MGAEYYFLFVCVGGLILLAGSLAFSTAIMGKSYCKSFQFMWSSLTYSAEADEKINMLLSKMSANMIVAKLDSRGNNIVFKSHDGDTEGEINIEQKYYRYGYLTEYGGTSRGDYIKKRPKLKTFKKIVALEEALRGASNDNQAPPTAKKDDRVVELI